MTDFDITTNGALTFQITDGDGDFLLIDLPRRTISVGDMALVDTEFNENGIIGACNLDLFSLKALRLWLDEAIQELEANIAEDQD